ncbi:hypothetical protein [Taibaiella helva]|uniref:hypothetical protein n=1 Tax=Taibaiella helva TaxID=2301235 RepID=UPI000E56F0DD|nr:hypothetical protein [Taibaiella helva]
MELKHFDAWAQELQKADVIYEIHEVKWESAPGPFIDIDKSGKIKLVNAPDNLPAIEYKAKENFSSFNGFRFWWQYKKHILELTSNTIIELSFLFRKNTLTTDEEHEIDTKAISIIATIKKLKNLFRYYFLYKVVHGNIFIADNRPCRFKGIAPCVVWTHQSGKLFCRHSVRFTCDSSQGPQGWEGPPGGFGRRARPDRILFQSGYNAFAYTQGNHIKKLR